MDQLVIQLRASLLVKESNSLAYKLIKSLDCKSAAALVANTTYTNLKAELLKPMTESSEQTTNQCPNKPSKSCYHMLMAGGQILASNDEEI